MRNAECNVSECMRTARARVREPYRLMERGHYGTKTWLCQDYDINFLVFFSLFLVEIFSFAWRRRRYIVFFSPLYTRVCALFFVLCVVDVAFFSFSVVRAAL